MNDGLNLLHKGLENLIFSENEGDFFQKSLDFSENIDYSENEIQELINLKDYNKDYFESLKKNNFNDYFGIYITALSSNLIKKDSDEIHIDVMDSKLNKLGYKWGKGKLIINGNAGISLGSNMEGGKIELFGNSGPCIGFFMDNGSIKVYGNADHSAGAYMKGGIVEIFGNAEFDAGYNQRGGLLFIEGNAIQSAGRSMGGGALIAKTIDKISKFYYSGAIISSNNYIGVDKLIKNNPNSIPFNLISNDVLNNKFIYENMEKLFYVHANSSQESINILLDFKNKIEWALTNLKRQ
jgi:formylmethanofuran dehydrogenase subunit C